MKTPDQPIAQYTKAHILRAHGSEDGSVRIAPRSKVKKWQGIYHVTKTRADGTTGRNTMYRIIGLCAKMTKREAEVEHREWCKDFHGANRAVATTRTGKQAVTVADIATDYIRFKRWDKPGGGNGMASLIKNDIIGGLGHLKLKETTAEDVRSFVFSLENRVHAPRPNRPTYKPKTGASVSVVNKITGILRGMFALAQERDLIVKNPTQSQLVKIEKPEGLPPVSKPLFSPKHLPALLSQLNERDSLVVWISFLAGTRPNETFAIHGDDIGPGYIAIRHALDVKRKIKLTKTDEPRIVAIPPVLDGKIQAWIRGNGIGADDLLFLNQRGKPVSRNAFRDQILKPAAERAGLASIGVDFRMLRRSFGTVAAALGADVKSIQTQLGHSQPDMSYREYVQPVAAMQMAYVTKVEQVLLGLEEMPYDITKKMGSQRVQ